MVLTLASATAEMSTTTTQTQTLDMREMKRQLNVIKGEHGELLLTSSNENGDKQHHQNGQNGTTNGHHANGNANGTTAANTTAPAQPTALLTVDARNYVPNLVADDQRMRELAEYGLDYAHSIGLCARTVEHKFESDIATTPPLALMPSPFPLSLYTKAFEVQETLNELYFRISCDHEFLLETYKDVIKGDPYIKRCLEIAQQIHDEGVHQPLALSVQRADYLSHWDEQKQCIELKQVEVNIGQIGGPGCATQTNKYHRKMLDKLAIVRAGTGGMEMLAHTEMPVNKPRHKMGRTLYEAWKLFGDQNAVLLFVNQPDLFPFCHFEQLQFTTFEVEKLAKRDGNIVQVIRMTFKECAERCHLDESNFSLYADGKRVALVHMAYGYIGEHYPTEAEWQVRIAMERSTAIISPNIRLQLTGTKKIQQVLSKPGVMEKFFPDEPQRVAALRDVFTGLWGLENDDAATNAVIEDAIQRPRDYVLKAQMGAGKGNFFDDEMVEKLNTMSLEERGAYILMKKIWPVAVKNYLMRPFQVPYLENVVSELGIYGSIIADSSNGKVLWNSAEGYLSRSKPANLNQGGVCEGSGVVDSVLLFPDNEFVGAN
ncbi:hypothetical protein niasHT_008278 [Heterodera trifolii]|uniref:Glutathione synthetase n=1 Tax=Heterodera trifolii TaxID=157864 RepID=A0ABD2M1E9_9BILA